MAKRRRVPPAEKKAQQRADLARASYIKAEDRVGDLRLQLARAEQKLARRTERLSAAETALAVLAAPPAQAAAPPEQAAEEPAAMPANTTENGVTPTPRPRARRKVPTPDET